MIQFNIGDLVQLTQNKRTVPVDLVNSLGMILTPNDIRYDVYIDVYSFERNEILSVYHECINKL